MSKEEDILNHLLNLCHGAAVILSISSSRTLHHWSCDLKLSHFKGFFQSGSYPPELYSITATSFCLQWKDFKVALSPFTHKGRVCHRQTFPQPEKILRLRCRGKRDPSIDSGIQALVVQGLWATTLKEQPEFTNPCAHCQRENLYQCTMSVCKV